ncbi:hypothetical protein EHS17_08120 [Rhodobacteraceae bacterium CH30]|nr:hypothetical protein EHS17_08120 [Rhodobacteraceae bacterium CH30]
MPARQGCQITQQTLPMLRELYQISGGDLTMMLVLLEVWVHAHCNCRSSGGALRATNGHSITLVTGIPRETVRRKLAKLVALDWLSENVYGQLLPTPRLAEQLQALREHCPALIAKNKKALQTEAAGLSLGA